MATIDNIPLQQGEQPTHLNSGSGDAFLLGSELFKENPFMLNKYYKQSGRDMTTLQKIKAFFPGRLQTKASYSPTTGHWEKPRWNKTITVGSITQGSESNEAVITLTQADMVTDTAANGITYVRSRPRVTETLQVQAGGIHYWITEKDTTVNPHKITVKSADNSSPLDAFVPGSKAVIGPPTKGEGTGQVGPLVPRRYRYENTFVIIDETDAVSGSHMTSTARFQPVPGSNLLFLEGLQDMEKRHQYGKGYKWLFDDQVTPNNWVQESPILRENVAISGTQGLIAFIKQSGREFVYDPADFELEDLYALSNYYHDINIGTSEILLIQGYSINQLIERAYGGKLNYEWVIGVSDKYISESMRHNWGKAYDGNTNPQGAFINLGISGFALGQFTFMQTASPEFNDMYGPGAIGYKDWMIAAPWGNAAVDGADIPYLGYEYRGSDGYSREDEVWTRSGAGNARIARQSDFYKTSENDGTEFFERSEIAAHFALGEQFALFTPESTSS